MAQALHWAEQGLYSTTPNPRVGCVIVKDERILGHGWHQRAGDPHAEINALKAAQAAGENLRGATLYVSLEPCCHHGRTAPCTDALIAAGISRLVAAMPDPNPQVAGQGLAQLRAAGIDCAVGLMQQEAMALNPGFISRMTRARPWLRLKIAASLDGKTALENGQSQWLTGEPARHDGHHWRARACAVLTGIGTVQQDDPQLTVRAVETARQPLRIVLDSQLRVSLSAKLLPGAATDAAHRQPVLIVSARHDAEKIAALRALGAEVLVLANARQQVDLPALCSELARRGINELHVEAGAKLNAALLSAGLVDELLLYFAPCLLGNAARGMFELPPLLALHDLRKEQKLSIDEVRILGADLRVLARVNPQ